MKTEQKDGSEWIRLQRLKADKQERDNLLAAKRLLWREDVERTTAELWQMVGNDLRYTLPIAVSDRLTGAGDPAIIRTTVRTCVDELIRGWKVSVPDRRVKAVVKKKKGVRK